MQGWADFGCKLLRNCEDIFAKFVNANNYISSFYWRRRLFRKEPITGTFKVSLAGRVYPSETGEAADFHLDGTLSESKLKGTGGRGEHPLSFTARKAD